MWFTEKEPLISGETSWNSINWGSTKEMIKGIDIAKEQSWANAPHAIASALNWLKSLMWWNVTVETPNKKNFGEELDKLNNELPALKKYIESKASTNVTDVNVFLKNKGIDLELKDQWDWLYSASVLDVKVDWETPWTKSQLNIDKREIDAVKMKNVNFYNSKHEHPIIEINTKSWEKVFMTKYDWPLAKNSIGIYKSVKSISENKNFSDKKEVIFPMVDFQDKWDIEELKWWSLSNNKEKANIAEAKYFHRFRMNEKWARAQAAAATWVTRSMALSEPYKIDWPFLVWIETEKWEIPFAAKIWINDMKNPGSLGDDKEVPKGKLTKEDVNRDWNLSQGENNKINIGDKPADSYSREKIWNWLKDWNLLERKDFDQLIKNDIFKENFEKEVNLLTEVNINSQLSFENFKKYIFPLKIKEGFSKKFLKVLNEKNFNYPFTVGLLPKISNRCSQEKKCNENLPAHISIKKDDVSLILGEGFFKQKENNNVEYNFYEDSPYYGIKLITQPSTITEHMIKDVNTTIVLNNEKTFKGIVNLEDGKFYFKNSNEKDYKELIEVVNEMKSDKTKAQAPTDQNPNQNPEPVPETSSISANYSENIQKADNWDNSDNNWIINDLIWIKQEKGIQNLKNMNSENIKTLLEEFKENFKFKNMKERNPKWVQVTLWVQVALSILWYSAGTIDGYYWPNTTNAVKEFQKNNNLKIDWIAWSETISKIIELLDKKSS